MTDDINDLERDIEETRARLDVTIDQLQDRLSVSGIVDDMIGTMRAKGLDSAFDRALAVVRRNPVPVMLVAAGVGWLLHRMSRGPERRGDGLERVAAQAPVAVLNTGRSRIYDPDADPLHPMRDAVEPETDLAARA